MALELTLGIILMVLAAVVAVLMIFAFVLRMIYEDLDNALLQAVMAMTRNTIHVSLLIFLDFNMWKIYLLGIPGQIAVFLWFRMYRPMKEKEKTYE